MPATTISAAHLSGRFDRPAAELREQLDEVTLWADLVTVTEVDRAERAAVLARDGWSVLRRGDGDRGESAVVVRDAAWRVSRWEIVMLDDDLDGVRRGQVAVIALLEHAADGSTLLVSTTHTSAGVEGAWIHGRRAVEHRAAVGAWRRTVRSWRREHRPVATLVLADWNLDAHKPWVRTWIDTAWPALTLPRLLPAGGSLGHRLIDWVLSSGVRRVRLEVLDPSPASDHRAVRVTGTLRARATTP